ncbi:hypothetical protein BDZ97DRAFT_1912971 [Flammula alnicola]|nr:hypothetical protein BDZ97DRAFT_1912971 [Flammula alnicola]
MGQDHQRYTQSYSSATSDQVYDEGAFVQSVPSCSYEGSSRPYEQERLEYDPRPWRRQQERRGSPVYEEYHGPKVTSGYSKSRKWLESERHLTNLTRHTKSWLYDASGSIMLSVQNKLFRVHQTILANHSEVFADLFTVSQPEGEHKVEACHVVDLYNDEREFVGLSNAVYIPHQRHISPQHKVRDLSPLPMLHNPSTQETASHIRGIRGEIVHLFYFTRSVSIRHCHGAVCLAQENSVPEALLYAAWRYILARQNDHLVGRERLQSSARPPLVNPRCAPISKGPTQSDMSWRNTSRALRHTLRAYDAWGLLSSYCHALHGGSASHDEIIGSGARDSK